MTVDVCAVCRRFLPVGASRCPRCPPVPVKPMPGFRERLCRCNADCPLGRIGAQPRCTEAELRAAGVAVQQLDECDRPIPLPTGQSASFDDAVPRPDLGVPRAVAFETPGSFRVYFHRLNPEGLPWCVSPDSGAWEIAVRNVVIGTSSTAVYRPKAKPDDEDGRPSAWIAVTGTLTVCEDGLARIGP